MESIPYNSKKRNPLGSNLFNFPSRFELVKIGIKMIYSGISDINLQNKSGHKLFSTLASHSHSMEKSHISFMRGLKWRPDNDRLDYYHQRWCKYMDEIKNKSLNLLKAKQGEIEKLKEDLEANNIFQWKNEVLMILDNLISSDSKYYKEFNRLDYRSSVFSMGDAEGNRERNLEASRRDLETAFSVINAIIFGIENDLI